MAVFEIPLRSDLPAYSFRMALDGTVYNFRFNWNSRTEQWFFDIMEQNDSPILFGQPVIVNYPVIQRFKDSRLPRGRLYFYDTSSKKLDPTRTDLGSRVIMIYEDEAENA